jgi:hypothetical protein
MSEAKICDWCGVAKEYLILVVGRNPDNHICLECLRKKL